VNTNKPCAWLLEPKVQRHPSKHLVRRVSVVAPTEEEREFAELDGDRFVPLYDRASQQDCRLCAYFTTQTGGCTSVVQCVDSMQFTATPPRRYWKESP